MIRTGKVLFCDNEHGIGNVTFPEMGRVDDQTFIQPMNAAQLRKQAKDAGWTRVDGVDYCADCSYVDPLNYAQE